MVKIEKHIIKGGIILNVIGSAVSIILSMARFIKDFISFIQYIISTTEFTSSRILNVVENSIYLFILITAIVLSIITLIRSSSALINKVDSKVAELGTLAIITSLFAWRGWYAGTAILLISGILLITLAFTNKEPKSKIEKQDAEEIK